MIHFFNANSTSIAMRCPWRTVYIASHAKFDGIHFRTIGYDVFDLNMTLDMLIFRDRQEFAVHLISFVLNKHQYYNFLNYARLGSRDPDEGVKVCKLKNDEYPYHRKVMLSAKPAQMQYFVQNDGKLDGEQSDGGLFGFSTT